MIALLTVALVVAWAGAIAGAVASAWLALLAAHAVLSLGASLTEGETPAHLGSPRSARGVGPRLPIVTPARAVSEQPRHGGPGSAVQPQVHSDPQAPEARRAPGVLHATIQRGWDHQRGGYTVTVRPEPSEASRRA